MPSSPTLPLETIQTVIDILGQDDKDLSSLKACSLVCQTFLHLCRKHIFGSIVLDGHKFAVPKPTTASLIRLLSATPEIAAYIRNLEFYISKHEFDQPSLPRIFKEINKLESLTIRWPRYQHQWSHNPLRSPLLHLLYLPTLTHFELRDIADFNVSDLVPCTNLQKFSFGRLQTVEIEEPFPFVFPEEPIRLNHLSAEIESSTAVSRMRTLKRPDGKPVFDFAVLASVSFVLRSPEEFDAARRLFQHCEQLNDVDIFLTAPPLTWKGLSTMLHPSKQALTRLRLRSVLEDESGTDDPLSGLASELESMRDRNQIENIEICISVQTDYDCNRGDGWGQLDEALTRSGWPKLRNVSLHITIWSYSREDDLEVTLKQFPETQYPRLSSSKLVLFDFSVTNIMV